MIEKHCCVGNVLWSVVKLNSGEKFIACIIMAGRNGHMGWGYKDMCESMGPCYHSCPLSYLDMVPEPKSEYAAGWRDKVREYHRKFTVGARYKLRNCRNVTEVTITSTRPMRGVGNDGVTYRLKRNIMGEQIHAACN